MKKKSVQRGLVLAGVLVAEAFASGLLGKYILGPAGYGLKLMLAFVPGVLICFYYHYHLAVKGYELKPWKVLVHFTVLVLSICFGFFYPVWTGMITPLQMNWLIVSIVHLELFKLLFRPRMFTVSIHVYVFCCFTPFCLIEGYEALGVFLWLFTLTMVPLYFMNSRNRQKELVRERKLNEG